MMVKELMEDAFKSAGFNTRNLSVVYSRTANGNEFVPSNDDEVVTNNQLYRIAKAFVTTLSK